MTSPPPPPPIIFEEMTCPRVEPEQMDALWARGWRHFGEKFFRNSLHAEEGRWRLVLPLRMRLAKFLPSKSQRRVLRKNADVAVTIELASITAELSEMFEKHKQRFSENVPEDLSNFLGEDPGAYPCKCLMLRGTLEGRTVAASFMDVGRSAVSSVYGLFDPDFSARSLGIFTMLREIEFCAERGMEFYYPGYATHGPSRYDYKKQFSGLEGYDWLTQAWWKLSPKVT